MIRKPIIAALLAWALPLAAAAQGAADEAVTTFTLDNGMEVVVVEDHRAPPCST
jgi:zinc protease